MDPVTIGASVVTLLAPYAKDAGKELVKTIGEAAVQKTTELMQWLKTKFAGDPVASSDLSRFEKDPTAFAPGLQATIDSKAKEDPAFSAELGQRVKALGPVIKIVQEFEQAKNLIGLDAEAVKSGQIDVTQRGKTAEQTIGVKGKIIG